MAIGHTWRHRPGATTSKAGRTGMAKPQSNFKPHGGAHHNSANRASVTPIVATRMAHHSHKGKRASRLV